MRNDLVRPFLLLIALILSVECVGQTPVLDSLKLVLKKYPKNAVDTNKVLLLCELGRGKDEHGLLVGDYRECIGWLTEAEQIAQRLKWNKGLMLANLYAGVWDGWKGYSLKGLQKKQKALYYAEVEQNPYWLGIVCRHLGDQYSILKNYDRAIAYLTRALKLSEKTNRTTFLLVNQNLGIAYYGNKDYKNANFWLEKAYKLCVEDRNQQLLKYVSLNWAEVCLATGDTVKLDQLLDEYPLINFVDRAWDVHYRGLNGRRYLAQQNPEKALEELKIGLENLEAASDQHRQEIFLQLSHTYEFLGEPALSLRYYKKYNELWERDIQLFQQKQTEYLKYEYENRKQEDAIVRLNEDVAQQKKARNLLWLAVILAVSFAIFVVWNNRVLNRKNKLIENQRNELLVLQKQLFDSNQQLIHFNEELEQKIAERTKEILVANEELTRKNLEIRNAFVNGKTVERKRVASELHDNLGSTISGLIWQLQSIMPEDLLPRESEIYNGLIQQMRNAYTEIRHISHHLYPIELEKGLEGALVRLIHDLNHNRKIHFQLRGAYPKDSLSKEHEIELYSICLELINNTIKHSGSTECFAEFVALDSSVILIFADNGKGFDPTNAQNRGRGLANIRDRVESLNGVFEISFGVGKGVTFKIELPKG